MEQTKHCAACVYWVENKRKSVFSMDDVVKTLGDCRRNPPTVFGDETKFPKTNNDCWCGEFSDGKQVVIDTPTKKRPGRKRKEVTQEGFPGNAAL